MIKNTLTRRKDLIWEVKPGNLGEGGPNPEGGTIPPIGQNMKMKTTLDEENVFHDSKDETSGQDLGRKEYEEETDHPIANARNGSDTLAA